MKNIPNSFVKILFLCFFIHSNAKAQSDSTEVIEDFLYNNVGNITYSGIYGYDNFSGSNVKYRQENYYYYPSYYADHVDFIKNMKTKRILDRPIKIVSKIAENGNWTNIRDEIFIYDTAHSETMVKHFSLPRGIPQIQENFNNPNGTYSVDNKYRLLNTTDFLDNKGRPIQTTDLSGITSCFMYSKRGLLIGTVQNASIADIGYTSFEKNENQFSTGWTFTNLAMLSEFNDIPRGLGSGVASFDICEKANLNPDKSYILSFFVRVPGSSVEHDFSINTFGGNIALLETEIFDRQNGKLKKYIYKVSAASKIAMMKNGANVVIDELRIFPADAFMSTTKFISTPKGFQSFLIIDAKFRHSTISYNIEGDIENITDHREKVIMEKEYVSRNY